MQTIRPSIDIAIVIGFDTVWVAVKHQIDPEAGVRENLVADQRVVDGGSVMHLDSGVTGIAHRRAAAVEGDDVARVRVGAAHGVVMTANEDPARVAQRLCACDIGANDVTLDEIAGGVLCKDHTCVAIVARDQIPGRRAWSGCQAADNAIRDASIEIHANVGITEGDCSGDVRTNEVALDRVVRSSEQVNAAVVRGYDVTGISIRTTNEVI